MLATFQRTAETRRAAPTPTIAPVMVCVVETGNAEPGRHEQRDGAAGLGAEALHRRQLGDPQAHGAHDAPAAHSVPSAIEAWQVSTTQNGTENSAPR